MHSRTHSPRHWCIPPAQSLQEEGIRTWVISGEVQEEECSYTAKGRLLGNLTSSRMVSWVRSR